MGKRRNSSDEAESQLKKQRKHDKTSKLSENSQESISSSVFQNTKLELIVSILPSGLNNIAGTIEESVHRYLLKYSGAIKGIPLAFNNVKLTKDGKGMILNELPHIHYNVACDAIVFAPQKGDSLSGVVRESFHSHLSMVVLNYFNASISAKELRAKGFTFDGEREVWRDSNSSVDLSVDDCVNFRVHKIHESAGIISMEGSKPTLDAAL